MQAIFNLFFLGAKKPALGGLISGAGDCLGYHGSEPIVSASVDFFGVRHRDSDPFLHRWGFQHLAASAWACAASFSFLSHAASIQLS